MLAVGTLLRRRRPENLPPLSTARFLSPGAALPPGTPTPRPRSPAAPRDAPRGRCRSEPPGAALPHARPRLCGSPRRGGAVPSPLLAAAPPTPPAPAAGGRGLLPAPPRRPPGSSPPRLLHARCRLSPSRRWKMAEPGPDCGTLLDEALSSFVFNYLADSQVGRAAVRCGRSRRGAPRNGASPRGDPAAAPPAARERC